MPPMHAGALLRPRGCLFLLACACTFAALALCAAWGLVPALVYDPGLLPASGPSRLLGDWRGWTYHRQRLRDGAPSP